MELDSGKERPGTPFFQSHVSIVNSHEIDKILSRDDFGGVAYASPVCVASPYAILRVIDQHVPEHRLGDVAWDILDHERERIMIDGSLESRHIGRLLNRCSEELRHVGSDLKIVDVGRVCVL